MSGPNTDGFTGSRNGSGRPRFSFLVSHFACYPRPMVGGEERRGAAFGSAPGEIREYELCSCSDRPAALLLGEEKSLTSPAAAQSLTCAVATQLADSAILDRRDRGCDDPTVSRVRTVLGESFALTETGSLGPNMVARTGSILDPNHALPACLHARITDSPRSVRSSGTYNLTNHYDGDARSLIEPTVFKEPHEANEQSEGCGDTARPCRS